MKKMKQSDIPKNVDEYLAGVPEPARSTLQKMRKTIQAMVPPESHRGDQLPDADLSI